MAAVLNNECVFGTATQAASPAGGTGVTAGCYSTAANRDIFINLVNAMRTTLINAGLMAGGAANNDFAERTPNENVPSGANQVAAPAGGTGADAGSYDTAANRDICINLINEMRLILIAHGLMVGSGAISNFLAETPNERVTVGATQVAAPAGGTGPVGGAGGFSLATNRDTCINLVNAMRTVMINAKLMTGAA